MLRERAGRETVEHIVIADGPRRVRLEVRGDSAVAGPVFLDFAFSGPGDLHHRALALNRVSALWRFQRLPARLHQPDKIAPRLVMALHAWDARQAGATRAEIAGMVFGPAMVRDLALGDWRMMSLRKRVTRLLDLAARRMESARERFMD